MNTLYIKSIKNFKPNLDNDNTYSTLYGNFFGLKNKEMSQKTFNDINLKKSYVLLGNVEYGYDLYKITTKIMNTEIDDFFYCFQIIDMKIHTGNNCLELIYDINVDNVIRI